VHTFSYTRFQTLIFIGMRLVYSSGSVTSDDSDGLFVELVHHHHKTPSCMACVELLWWCINGQRAGKEYKCQKEGEQGLFAEYSWMEKIRMLQVAFSTTTCEC